MENSLDKKDWLIDEIKKLQSLSQGTKKLMGDSDSDEWTKKSRKSIEENDWLISTIKQQLLTDYISQLSQDELDLLESL